MDQRQLQYENECNDTIIFTENREERKNLRNSLVPWNKSVWKKINDNVVERPQPRGGGRDNYYEGRRDYDRRDMFERPSIGQQQQYQE